MYDLKDFKAADHIPALLDWMRAQMKACGGKTAVIGISGGKDSLTLLYALSGLMRFYPHSFSVHAVTVDLGFENMIALLN